MEGNRIQKLLMSEYKEFSDMILIESPFAETTRNGQGVREVALGLTSSKFIIATDILSNNNEFICPSDLDPSIETLELVSVYPLEFITLSIFRRRQRKTLKARLIDGKANYFELGGMHSREIFWNLWCEQIQILLSQKENGSSLSEATAASSSSASTLYFLSSDVDKKINDCNRKGNRCVCRLWTHYGGAGDVIPPSWTRKDIYIGPNYDTLGPNNYSPAPTKISNMNIENLKNELQFSKNKNISLKPYHRWSRNKLENVEKKTYCNCNNDLCGILFTQDQNNKRYLERGDYINSIDGSFSIVNNNFSSKFNGKKKFRLLSHEPHPVSIPKLSRFGFGVEEKCTAGLYLPPHRSSRNNINITRASQIFIDPYKIIESGVAIWEQNKWRRSSHGVKGQLKHFRRYGLATAPHFLYALGPWPVQDGDKISIQSKKSLSCVNICKQTLNNELKLRISKRQLTTSVSMTSLGHEMLSTGPTDQGCVLLFWTPKYWYRPRAAIAAYRELRQHLDLLRDFQQQTNRGNSVKKYFSKKNGNTKYYGDNNYKKMISCDKATCILNKIFSLRNGKDRKMKNNNLERSRSTNKLHDLLKINLKITAWDLDSTTLAKQLTLIDRDLFLRIPITEVKILIKQKSSRNTSNIGAFIAFSHRISCLVTSEILAIGKLTMRTRILARFINAANKCFTMGNFQSCRSIVAGLQSPAIYRLKSTWSYLKSHHPTSYAIISKLCKIFQNVRIKMYTDAWENAERSPPLIPYIGHILVRILGLDINSNSFICEFPERKKNTIPLGIQKKWDGGATFLSQVGEQKNYCTNIEINANNTIDYINVNNTEDNKCNCKCESKPIINHENTMKKLISSALMRLRYGKYTPIKSSRKSIFWAARQLIIARKYFERWQLSVMTEKIIIENEKNKKITDIQSKKIEEVILWIIICQRNARGYDFPGHSLAWEFLLKARYREERENFDVSRRLEPLLD